MCGKKDAAIARKAGCLEITGVNREDYTKAMSIVQKFELPPGFRLASKGQVSHYQGNGDPDLKAILLRFTQDGELNLGGEHVSFTVGTGDFKILGMARMLKEGGQASLVDAQKNYFLM